MKSTNHAAVIVAAVVFFALGAVWYNVFSTPWLAGIGKTAEQITRESDGSPMPYVIGFVAILVMCYTLAWIIARGPEPTASNGALTGATVALGVVGAALALNYGFEARGITLWLINTGYDLIGLVIAGAIIGGWRKKTRVET